MSREDTSSRSAHEVIKSLLDLILAKPDGLEESCGLPISRPSHPIGSREEDARGRDAPDAPKRRKRLVRVVIEKHSLDDRAIGLPGDARSGNDLLRFGRDIQLGSSFVAVEEGLEADVIAEGPYR